MAYRGRLLHIVSQGREEEIMNEALPSVLRQHGLDNDMQSRTREV
jgi:hypothetical protein